MYHPTPARKMKESECLGGGEGFDIISNFHQDIITEKIPCHLPVQDLVKTSILSRTWRYLWANTPVIIFDDRDNRKFYYGKEEFVNAIFHVLLLHNGLLVDFTLSVKIDPKNDGVHNNLDQIILYLSRTNTFKSFTLLNTNAVKYYRMPSSLILSILKGLQRLCLTNCYFETPLTFHDDDQLSKLTYLRLNNVKIYAKTLKSILTNCPLLKQLYLLGSNQSIREDEVTIFELLECLQPSIEFLAISDFYFGYFVCCGMPQKLQVSLLHLKELSLGVYLMKKDHFSSILRLIKSFPNLKKLYINLSHDVYFSMSSFILEDYSSSGFKLENLEELEVRHFSNLPIEVELLKLVISKSFRLKKVMVVHNNIFTADEEQMILRDLTQSASFQRCSSPNLAKIIIKRDK